MDYETLERIVRPMQALATEAVAKRRKFMSKNKSDMANMAANESLGIGKCLAILVEQYPEEMAKLTAPEPDLSIVAPV